MCLAPARLAGLDSQKGSIAVGKDADLVIFDDKAKWTLEARDLFSRHPLSPYVGSSLQGRVLQTFLRGRSVYGQGRHSEQPLGRRLFRS
jgi:allantoinase